MTTAQLETTLRNKYLTLMSEFVENYIEADALRVSASELAIPCVDDEGNEKFIIFKVSVPRGTRNGEGGYDPYDGYAVAEDYAEECKEKAEKKAQAEAKKQAKIAKDKAKREEKKALAEANKGLKEIPKLVKDHPKG